MTDLERAREILAGYPLETAQYVIAEALAAARREAVDDIAELKCDISRLLESLRLAEEEIDDLRSQLAAERGA